MFEEPIVYTAHQLKNYLPQCPMSGDKQKPDGTFERVEIWTPVRSLTMRRLVIWRRLKLAFDVFIGKADVLYWDRLFPNDKKGR